MMSIKALLGLFLVSLCSHFGHGDSSYMCLTPQEFHVGWSLGVVCTVQEVNPGYSGANIKVTLAMRKKVTGLQLYDIVSEDFSATRGETHLLSLQIPETIPAVAASDSFVIRMELTNGVTATTQNDIFLNRNQSVVMVQADKNIYKPGQDVLFRVLNVNQNLQPMSKELSAFIVNPGGSKLERFENLNSTTGVTERVFSLSQYSSLGTWQIQIMDEGLNLLHASTFVVEEFVLPKFSVEVTADPNFLLWNQINQDGPLPTIMVKAIYTYGRAVQGECKLTLNRFENSDVLIKKIPESGMVEFTDISWSRLVGSQPTSSKILLLQAEVEDETGRKETGNATITIYRSQYKVEILPSSSKIMRPGLPSEFHIRLSDHNGNLITNKEVEIRIQATSYMTSNPEDIIAVREMAEGEPYIKYEFEPLPTDQRELAFSIKASLIEDALVSDTKKLAMYKSSSPGLIQVKRIGDGMIRKGQPVDFKVESNIEIASDITLSYMVVSQGTILEAGNIVNMKITLTPTLQMCPEGRLIAYMIQPNSGSYEVVLDDLTLSPHVCLDKRVTVSFDAKETRIGANTDMNIRVDRMNGSKVSPGIHDVYYMAVDTSIVMLQGSTEMNENKILSSLAALNIFEDIQEKSVYSTGLVLQHLRLDAVGNVTYENVEDHPIYYEDEMMFDGEVAERDVMFKTPTIDNSEQDDGDEKKVEETGSTTDVRKNFPDTWLWGKAETSLNGQVKKQVTLPDTITTWEVSAFAINEEGIAYSRQPFELIGFQPFFLSMNLPYSIKRGEMFLLRITVFNYRGNDVDAVVKLKQNLMFSVLSGQSKDGWNGIPIKIKAGLASSAEFKINATTIGEIELEAMAEDNLDGNKDQVIRKLLVKAEGVQRMEAMTSVLRLDDETPMSKLFEIGWPTKMVVPDSQRLQVKITGETFGQALSGLERLVVQPTGCGEQNMITTVPNIYGLTYIKVTKQRNMDETVAKLEKYMKKGYAREVDNYRHPDGSYSAWGTRYGDKGSTWLTAFVLKSFAQASHFMSVDDEVLKSAMDFILSKQSSSGAFVEDGKVLHKDIQTGTGSGLGMTVYCLLSMLEAQEALQVTTMNTEIEKATSYIISQIERGSMDSFTTAMTAYALAMLPSKPDAVNSALNNLISKIEDSKMPWLATDGEDASQKTMSTSSITHSRPSEIQTAAYLLLAYSKMDNLVKAMKLMKWLQSQQNAMGGFRSTQDTVLVLQSLAKIGELIKTHNKPGNVIVDVPSEGLKRNIDISGERAILLQLIDIPATADKINVTLTGVAGSMAIVKVVTFYNSFLEDEPSKTEKSFNSSVELKTLTFRRSNNEHQVQACVKSQLPSNTGMYVATLSLPSGEMSVDTEAELLRKNRHATRVEIEESDIHFYMDQVPEKGVCMRVDIEKQMEFEVQLPGDAKFYSYYEPDQMKEAPLTLSNSPICDTDTCDAGSTVTLTSLFLSVLICTMISLLVCV